MLSPLMLGRVLSDSVVPRLGMMTSPALALHTSSSLERARQATRIRKRKVAVENKRKKEERLRKNPPPLPRKVQMLLLEKGLKEPMKWRPEDKKPFPQDDVWSERWCTWPRLSVSDAVSCLREHYHPTLMDQPNALLWAKLELNLQNVKKDKYLEGFSKMVPIYHPFERGVAEKSIMVFCKDPEQAKQALAAGAIKAGGLELVDEVAKGKLDVSDVDYFLAHDDIIKELKPLIGILRDKMPSKANGCVSSNLERSVKTFSNGMLVSVVKPSSTLGYAEDPSYGTSNFMVGRLSMAITDLESNLDTSLATLGEQAPKREGGFFTRCQLYVEGPLQQKFDIHHPLVEDRKFREYVAEKQVVL